MIIKKIHESKENISFKSSKLSKAYCGPLDRNKGLVQKAISVNPAIILAIPIHWYLLTYTNVPTPTLRNPKNQYDMNSIIFFC